MKKIICIGLIMIIGMLVLSSCGKECEDCGGSGEKIEHCDGYYIALGGIVYGTNETHDDVCSIPGCTGSYSVECETCQGTGKEP